MVVRDAERARKKAESLSPEARAIALATWWKSEAEQAQQDVNVFMRLVFRNDQEDSLPFEQQWFHREWQDIWSTRRVSVIHGATGFGKTEQIIGHLLWRMGRDPTIRIVILGKKAANAAKLLGKIKRQIESNHTLRAIFPTLRQGSVWNGEILRLADAGIDTTTNTIEVYGIDGSPQGARADIVVADDILDFENTLTEYQRQKTIEFVDAAIQSRLTTKGQLHVLANAWHADDLAFTYKKRAEKGGKIFYRAYPAIHPVSGDLLWPSFRPREWLDDIRGTMSETTFCRMFLCEPRDEGTRIFKSAWFVAARALGGRLGIVPLQTVRRDHVPDGAFSPYSGLPLVAAMHRSDFLGIVVGVDLATKRTEAKRKTDETCFFSLGLRRDGKRQVLWSEKGRWSLDEKLDRFRDLDARYRPELFEVEDNGMQHDIVQYTQNMANFHARVEAFTTTKAKWDPENGIEGIGVEMRGNLWAIPAPSNDVTEDNYLAGLDAPQREALGAIRTWESRLADFSRVGHTPDDVMASYFARDAALRLGHGAFQHSHADEMSPMPVEAQQRRVAGLPGIVGAAFPVGRVLGSHAIPPPSDDPPEEALRAFGFR